MILPGKEILTGVIGTTFDLVITLYPAVDAYLNWQKPATWDESKEYKSNAAVVGKNGKAYKCLIVNTGVQPVGDVSGHWELITPLNITGYSSEVKIGSLELATGGKGVFLGGEEGTVSVKATPAQTEKFVKGNAKLSIYLTDTEKNKYEYITGAVKWQEP